ncbi:ABC transporter substrate-binding protein [Tomitella gaofuii]|uniref:ABC transporter substrate-binding protein n=1 Tax=Tomitella gaofuii TaxID=2760083 RepID=UPI002E2D57ED|nr:ABC transporter substrate-binding protein [Tomitella gaofuii]
MLVTRPCAPVRIPPRRTLTRILAFVFALLLGGAVAACGSSGGDAPGAAATAPGSPGDAPQRIVSLSPSATEILYAVGAGDQVVAVDDQSDYPQGVPTTDLSGYTPNLEAILGYQPDLVVFSDDNGDLKSGLDRVGVPYLQLPAPGDIEGAYEQFAQVGVVTGHADEAHELVGEVREQISAAIDSAGGAGEGLTYFHELDPTLYTVTSASFIGQVYSLFGLQNIADAASGAGAYPQLQSEFVVSANPDLIFLADAQTGGESPASVAQRPGWAGVAAVRDGQVHALDADITSRWGPRIGDLAQRIAQILADRPGT